MELLHGIDAPLPGERPLAVVPPLAPYVRPEAQDGSLRRRLNLFPQRALTHIALTDEQRGRINDTTLLAQAVSAGVIDGLEVAIEAGATVTRLAVMPGHAISIEGLDLELAYPLRFDPDAIPVHGETLGPWTDDGDALRTRIADGEEIRLGELVKVDGATRTALAFVPHAMVLVAQPVSVAIREASEEVTVCENATDAVVTPDIAWEDGFRLVWMPWPRDRALAPWTADGKTMDTRFRNRLAYTIFDDERRPLEADGIRSVRRMTESRSPDDPPAPRRHGEAPSPPVQRPWPWETLGVPLALVGFDAQLRPAFADRAAVVRQGGGPHNRTRLMRMAGDDALWQARVAQMLEHVAELPAEERDAAHVVTHFERLPPAGLLPLDAIDVEKKRQAFFPPTYDVQVQPVPLDMVDALMAESAPLASFNLSTADQVQVLVPVPSRYYERDLLNLDERIHPLFDIEIARLEDERLRLLRRRDALRRRIDLLTKAVSGVLPRYPEDDPNALPDESAAFDAIAFARVRDVQVVAASTMHWHGFQNALARLPLSQGDALMVFVRFNAPVASVSLRTKIGAEKPGVYWGAKPVEAGPFMVSAGALPTDEAGQPLTNTWIRLVAPVSLLDRNAAGQPIANPLAGIALDNLEFGVLTDATGSGVTWGDCGTLNGGLESYWVADAFPPGSIPSPNSGAATWTQDDGGVSDAENKSWGVSVDSQKGTFSVDELASLAETFRAAKGGLKREVGEAWAREAWTVTGRKRDAITMPAFAPPLLEQGLEALMVRLDQRVAAADDHVEVGFLRARTDIFRLRSGVLGTAMAGRLLTSPAAADLVQRSESAVATDKVFADYFTRAGSVKDKVDLSQKKLPD